MALFLDMAMGDTLDIDEGKVRLTFEEKRGRKARVRVDADDSVSINQMKPNSGQRRELNKL